MARDQAADRWTVQKHAQQYNSCCDSEFDALVGIGGLRLHIVRASLQLQCAAKMPTIFCLSQGLPSG